MSHENKINSTSDLKKKLETVEGEMSKNTQAPIELLEHPSYLELQEKLTKAEETTAQYLEKMLRVQAEMENIMRRAERDISNAHKFSLEKFASALLPIVDNLERALLISETTHSLKAVLEGVELTLKLFYSVLEKFGIQQINPEREVFNPELHQAISTQVEKSVAPGTILNVMQKGYLLNNRLLRPAMVIVSAEELLEK